MNLWGYIGRRLVLSIVVLMIVSIGTFAMSHAVPGSPVDVIIGERQAADPAIRASVEKKWGLDKPVPLQFVYYVKNLFTGNLGESVTTRRPVMTDLKQFVPGTVELALYSMLFSVGVGVPLGIIAATRYNRWPDHVSRFIALIGTSIPVFWLGLLALYVFFYRLHWLPGPGQLDVGMKKPPHHTGMITVDSLIAGDWPALWSFARHIILPATVLGSYAMGIIARMLRSSLLQALGDDYVRTGRAKGLTERKVVIGHALRNAMIPTVTILGLTFASLLAGAVLTETIFSWPGIGRYSVQAALKLDYPGLFGVTLVVAVAYVIVNLLVDILYGFLDPRIRVG
jgi:peptide/nickel transport system permease protein